MYLSNSETTSRGTSVARAKQKEFVLPQWAFDALRPVVRFLSRSLWNIRYRGRENIPQTGGLIIASNHQTYIDPFWISLPIRRPLRYLAWDVAFNWPCVGKLMRVLGAWPLQLEGSDPAPIRRSLQWLRHGGAIVIFPEGGRGRPDGSMNRFKAGAIRIALEAGVPILPVTIRGANRVWPTGRRWPRRGQVEVTYHPLYVVNQVPGEEARACSRRESERLAAIIASAL